MVGISWVLEEKKNALGRTIPLNSAAASMYNVYVLNDADLLPAENLFQKIRLFRRRKKSNENWPHETTIFRTNSLAESFHISITLECWDSIRLFFFGPFDYVRTLNNVKRMHGPSFLVFKFFLIHIFFFIFDQGIPLYVTNSTWCVRYYRPYRFFSASHRSVVVNIRCYDKLYTHFTE